MGNDDNIKPVKSPRDYDNSRVWFVNGRLYRTLHIDRISDYVLVWDTEAGEKKVIEYSTYRRKRERAYTLPEVAGLIGRNYFYIYELLTKEGHFQDLGVEYVAMNANPDSPNHKVRRYYTKDDVIKFHEFFARRSRGPKRKNSTWRVPKGMTARDELMAALNEQEVRYVKRDGEFIPVFKEV